MVLYFIYSEVTTCFGPYCGPSSGHKMNYLRKLYNVIYKIHIHEYEHLKRKLCNCNANIYFNQQCIQKKTQ